MGRGRSAREGNPGQVLQHQPRAHVPCIPGAKPRPLTPRVRAQLISPDGEIAEAYRKLHLFDVKHSGPSGGIMMESNTTIPGDKLLDPVETPIGKSAFRLLSP